MTSVAEPSRPVPTEDPPLDEATCVNCNATIERTYFRANARVVCPKCRVGLAVPAAGDSATRFWRALGLGLLASLIGGTVWFAVRTVSGYELGIIAIFVGLLVGGAVRKGSRGRGGWGYQILAMVLTYLTIVATYVPPLVEGIEKAAAGKLAAPPEDAAAPAMRTTMTVTPAPVTPKQPLHPPQGVVVGIAIIYAFSIPFRAGIMEVVIVGIALYEAWKINKRLALAFAGPYVLAPAAPPEPVQKLD